VKKYSHRGAEFAEIGEFFNQELFTQRPESVLSHVEGRLCGAISESYFTGMPEGSKFLAPTLLNIDQYVVFFDFDFVFLCW
jgi:hypothetical protein